MAMECYLKFKKVKVYFIYSFFLNIVRQQSKENSLNKDDLHAFYDIYLNAKRPDFWHRGKPGGRIGVPSNLKIQHRGNKKPYFDEVYAKINNLEAEVLPLGSDQGKICLNLEVLIRLHASGAGTVTFTFSLPEIAEDSFYTSLDIFKISNLVYRRTKALDEEVPKIKISNKETKRKEKNFRNNASIFEGKKQLFEHFQNLFEQEPIILPKDHWQDTEIIDISEESDEWQSPYVVIDGEIEDKNFDPERPWWDYYYKSSLTTEDYKKNQEMCLLLCRFLKGEDFIQQNKLSLVRLPEVHEDQFSPFRNYSWYKHIFIGFHPRSSLILTHGKNEIGIKEVIEKSLVDLSEIVRSRWHISVAISELLTADLNKLRPQPLEENVAFIEALIMRRKQLALFLNDPSTYIYEGGIVSDICEIARDKFHLDYLKNLILEKFDVIDKYCSNVGTLIQIKALKEVYDEKKAIISGK